MWLADTGASETGVSPETFSVDDTERILNEQQDPVQDLGRSTPPDSSESDVPLSHIAALPEYETESYDGSDDETSESDDDARESNPEAGSFRSPVRQRVGDGAMAQEPEPEEARNAIDNPTSAAETLGSMAMDFFMNGADFVNIAQNALHTAAHTSRPAENGSPHQTTHQISPNHDSFPAEQRSVPKPGVGVTSPRPMPKPRETEPPFTNTGFTNGLRPNGRGTTTHHSSEPRVQYADMAEQQNHAPQVSPQSMYQAARLAASSTPSRPEAVYSSPGPGPTMPPILSRDSWGLYRENLSALTRSSPTQPLPSSQPPSVPVQAPSGNYATLAFQPHTQPALASILTHNSDGTPQSSHAPPPFRHLPL